MTESVGAAETLRVAEAAAECSVSLAGAAVLSKTYAELPFREREILRYAGCRKPRDRDAGVDAVVAAEEIDEADVVEGLLRACVEEARGKLAYKVCYRVLPVRLCGGACDFGCFEVRSKKLAANLSGCDLAVVFAATVGVGIDRLIARYGRLAPSKAMMLQAIGTAQVEEVCDAFCADVARVAREGGRRTRPRFSPGYGDVPLEVQRDFFRLLDCEKRIGLTLNDNLFMSPSKSVTAFLGIEAAQACEAADCIASKNERENVGENEGENEVEIEVENRG